VARVRVCCGKVRQCRLSYRPKFFMKAAILGYFACAIHYCSYGQQALVLTRRKGKFSLSSTVSDVAAASNDGRSERGVETNTRVGIADNMPL